MSQIFDGYDAWVAGVRDWLDVDEFTDEKIQLFLSLANIRLNRDMMSYRMEKVAQLMVVGNGLPVNLDVSLPDFNKVRNVGWPGVGSLEVLALNEWYNKQQEAPDKATPAFYCIDAGKLLFHPMPASSVVIHFAYYQMVPPIGPTRDTNIFTEYHSDALLYGACLEAASYMVEDERIPVWESKYVAAVKGNNIDPSNVKKGSTPLVRRVKIG